MNIGNIPPHDTNLEEPSETNIPIFSEELARKILIELDGWQLINSEDTESDGSSQLFIDHDDEEQLKNISINHNVSIKEVEDFFNKAFDEALSYTNRYDIDDLDEIKARLFFNGVIKLTASNLWLKYNTSVTVNNDEGTIDYGQGGKLFKKYLTIIEPFIKGVHIEISAI
ncbi:hypothetical protein [Methanobrevibacter arboriphilus]|uniref:Uncharacterized protein n=1 Tax=Methanobrevibacter arboriphilus TaxID=39441 RepID=A0ACA8R1X6_METAZ|nr:hypothetical protein [Methanobrevibacter arboriphilus]BBL61510.1 hypothetical protein MarbSA_05500 [Methanobrevibacter arboriphilus]